MGQNPAAGPPAAGGTGLRSGQAALRGAACPGHPCQQREGHGGAGHPATPRLARTPPGWSKAWLPAGSPAAWPRAQGCQRQRDEALPALSLGQAGSPAAGPARHPRVSRLWCRSPCSTQSREPLGEQPDPRGPAVAHGRPPGPVASPPQHGVPVLGAPQGLSTASRHRMSPILHPGTAAVLVPASRVTQQGQGQPAAPPSTPLEIAQLPPPRQLPAASSPLPTADPGGGTGGQAALIPPEPT